MAVEIHPTAIVEAGAELDDGVLVGPYSIIGANVKVGRDSIIHPHVVLSGHTTVGARTTIFQFASVGAPPQDLKYKGEPTELILGDNNVIRECATLQAGTVQGNGKTVVGSNNLFMAYSHVAHDCVVGDGNIFANSATLAGHVTINNRVILGGLVAIHQFARIGDFAFIGGGAMVSKDVPPFAMVQGDRAKIVGVNVVGLRRAGFAAADVRSIRDFYREVLLETGTLESRLAALSEDVRANAEVARLLQFLNESKRGVCAPRTKTDEEVDFG